MYLSDIIRPVVNQKLKEMCVGKKVSFCPEDYKNKTTITCKSVNFENDDGDCWLIFTNTEDKEYRVLGQGIDIYFEVEEEGN